MCIRDRYYGGKCSGELASRIPPPLRRPRITRGALLSHECCVSIENPRLVRRGASFFPATSVLWNSLPPSVFPTVFNLPLFKACLLYTSDAADERSSVDLGGRR